MGRVKQGRVNSSRTRTRLRATPEGRQLQREAARSGHTVNYVPAARVSGDGHYTYDHRIIRTKRPKTQVWHGNRGGINQRALKGAFNRGSEGMLSRLNNLFGGNR